MINALALEVAAEAGVSSTDLLAAKQQEAAARSAFAQAVDRERAAIRIADERGPIIDCPRCIRCEVDGEILQTLLCARHGAQLHALRQATANRIGAQRRLADANYAVDLARKGQR